MSHWYRNKYPCVGDFVKCKIKYVDEISVLVSLVEYNDIEACILLTNLSRKKSKSAIHVRIGKLETAEVERIDIVKKYIDLNKVYKVDGPVAIYEEEYNNAKKCNSILEKLSRKTNISLSDIYSELWDLIDLSEYQTMHELFSNIINNHTIVDQLFTNCKDARDMLCKYIEKEYSPKIYEIRASISITCFSKYGAEGIRNVGKEMNILYPMTSCKRSSDLYFYITTNSIDPNLDVLNQYIIEFKNKMNKIGGDVAIIKYPEIIN